MASLITPTQHEMLAALRFPMVTAPILCVFVPYRFLWSYVASGAVSAAEAWRLSGYITGLFVLVAYPIVLSDYGDWLWKAHPSLSVAFILFWLSLCSWLLAWHFQLQSQEDDKLLMDLKAISHGTPLGPPVVSPPWLRVWGWGNGVALGALSVGFARILSSLP